MTREEWVCLRCNLESTTLVDVCPYCEGVHFEWKCRGCTFRNPSWNSECEVCMKPRRRLRTVSEWTCQSCTYRNEGEQDACAMCQQPKAEGAATGESTAEEQDRDALEELMDTDLLDSMDQLVGTDLLGWTCRQCTCENPGEYVTCQVCFASRAGTGDAVVEADSKQPSRRISDSTGTNIENAPRDAVTDPVQREGVEKAKQDMQDIQGKSEEENETA